MLLATMVGKSEKTVKMFFNKNKLNAENPFDIKAYFDISYMKNKTIEILAVAWNVDKKKIKNIIETKKISLKNKEGIEKLRTILFNKE